jgi:hypothetical protein
MKMGKYGQDLSLDLFKARVYVSGNLILRCNSVFLGSYRAVKMPKIGFFRAFLGGSLCAYD